MLEKMLGLALMVLRYAVFAVISIAANLLVWVLSPVLALLVVVEPWQGAQREWLPRWCRWLQTHDAPLDEWWRGGYYKNAFAWSAKLTDADFVRSAWLRYVARMCWLQRNPAYGLATYGLGYLCAVGKLKGLFFYRYSDSTWDSATSNYDFGVFCNPDLPLWGRYAFIWRGQFYYTRTRYLRVQIGWKVQREEPKVMLATHINPFRKWDST